MSIEQALAYLELARKALLDVPPVAVVPPVVVASTGLMASDISMIALATGQSI